MPARLDELLLVALRAVMSGAETWVTVVKKVCAVRELVVWNRPAQREPEE